MLVSEKEGFESIESSHCILYDNLCGMIFTHTLTYIPIKYLS